jgi:hypothetical protein
LITLALLCLGVALPVGEAVGQQKTLKDLIVGTWLLDSIYDQTEDRIKHDTWGPNVKGIVMFDGNGRFSFQMISADRPKSESTSPRTPVGPASSYFGTYTVDETAKTLTYQIERATYPQWDGVNRTANIVITTENEFNQMSAPIQDPTAWRHHHPPSEFQASKVGLIMADRVNAVGNEVPAL